MVASAAMLDSAWCNAAKKLQTRLDRYFVDKLKQRIEQTCDLQATPLSFDEPMPHSSREIAMTQQLIAPVRDRIRLEMDRLGSSPLADVLMAVARSQPEKYQKSTPVWSLKTKYATLFQQAGGPANGLSPIEDLAAIVERLLEDIIEIRDTMRENFRSLKTNLQARRNFWVPSLPIDQARRRAGESRKMLIRNGELRLFVEFKVERLPADTAWPSPPAIWEALGSMPAALSKQIPKIRFCTPNGLISKLPPGKYLSPVPCTVNPGNWASAWDQDDQTLLLLPCPVACADDPWSVRSTLMSQSANRLARAIASDRVRWNYWIERLQTIDPVAAAAHAAGYPTRAIEKLSATLCLYHDIDIDLRIATASERATLHARYSFLDSWT
jgi:hypothetical protein